MQPDIDITMTSAEETVFFSLLQYGLWGTPYSVSQKEMEKVRWDVIVENSYRQTVSGITGEAMLKLKNQLNYPDSIRLRILSEVGTLMKGNMTQNQDLVTLFQYITNRGFRPILLKGQGNAAHYPNPMSRACGDVDIYIGKEDYEEARKCLIELIGKEEVKKTEWEIPKDYEVNYKDTKVELHRIAVEWINHSIKEYGDALIDKWIGKNSAYKESIEVNGVTINVPPVQFNVIYVFLHLWHHFATWGIGLRQIVDWTILLHYAHQNKLLNEAELKADLDHLNILKEWQLMGNIAVQKLGLPAEEFPFYKACSNSKLSCLWHLIQNEGNFGKYGEWIGGNKKISVIIKKVWGVTKRCFRLLRLTPRYSFLTFYDFICSSIVKLRGNYYVKR